MHRKKTNKNVFFLFSVLSSINPILSENMIDPKTLTIPTLESLAADVKKILEDKKKEEKEKEIIDKDGALKRIGEIETKVKEDIKDEKTRKKILDIYLKDLKQFLENQPESLDGCIGNIETMKNLIRKESLFLDYSLSSYKISYNLPEEAKEVGKDLNKLLSEIIDIKKEEARKKISPEEWKKLPVKKLFRYFKYLDYGNLDAVCPYPNSRYLPVDNSNPVTDAFLKAIENDSKNNSLDYSSILEQEDFDIIIKTLWNIICRSDCEYDETVMNDKENNIDNKNPNSKLLYDNALAFMEKLVRKSKISDEESIFSDYVRDSFKYDTYMKNAVYSVISNSNSTKANMFREKISNNFARKLEANLFSFDYLLRPDGGPFGLLLTLPIFLTIDIFDTTYRKLSKWIKKYYTPLETKNQP